MQGSLDVLRETIPTIPSDVDTTRRFSDTRFCHRSICSRPRRTAGFEPTTERLDSRLVIGIVSRQCQPRMPEARHRKAYQLSFPREITPFFPGTTLFSASDRTCAMRLLLGLALHCPSRHRCQRRRAPARPSMSQGILAYVREWSVGKDVTKAPDPAPVQA